MAMCPPRRPSRGPDLGPVCRPGATPPSPALLPPPPPPPPSPLVTGAGTSADEGDPYVVVVQSAYLTRHVGGAVHMLVFAFIHGVGTSVVWRA